jgi:hypothetical protein
MLDTKRNYTTGGVIWTFDIPFNSLPTICVGIQLKTGGLADSIYPLCHKITNVTIDSVTIKIYKVTLSDLSDLVFSECSSNDVVVHITAEGE